MAYTPSTKGECDNNAEAKSFGYHRYIDNSRRFNEQVSYLPLFLASLIIAVEDGYLPT
jgi:hypothetical protein